MPGGGGANAQVGFPEYIENQHHAWLNRRNANPTSVSVSVADILEDLLPVAGNPHLDHGYTSFDSAWDASQTRLDNQFTLTTGFAPESDWCDYIEQAAEKVRTCTDTNIDTQAVLTQALQDGVSLFNQLKNAGYEQPFDATALLSTWGSDVQGFLETTDLFTDVDFDTVVSGAVTKANTAIAAAKTAKITGISLLTDWEALIDAAVTKADELGVLEATAVTATGYDYTDLTTKYNTLLTAVAGYDPEVDWDSYLDSVVTSIDTAGVLKSVSRNDIDAIVTAAISGADDAVAAAVTAAIAAANDAILTSLVNDFEARQLTGKAKSIRRFMGGIADANAEHSSAFLIGIALIEAEHVRNVAEFDNQLSLSAFQEGFRGHLQAYGQTLAAEIQTAIEVKRSRDQLLREGVQAISNLIIERFRLHTAAIDSLRQINLDQIRTELEARIRDKVSRDAFILQTSSQLVGLKTEEWNYEKFIMGLYGDIYNALVRSGLQAELAFQATRDGLAGEALRSLVAVTNMNKDSALFYLQQLARGFAASADAHLQGTSAVLQARTSLVNEGNRMMTQLASQKFSSIQAAINAQIEQNRMRTITTAEHESAEFDKDVQAALWNLEVYERAITVLSGPAGMQGRIPPKNSRAGSVLGGALGGAVTGAQLGSVGGVPGVAIGTVAGGLAGYFG